MELRYRRSDGQETAQGDESASAVTANIGVGGAFILTSHPEAVGSELHIAVTMPESSHVLELVAEVRWCQEASGEEQSGMGVKFQALDVEALLALRAYFSSLQ